MNRKDGWRLRRTLSPPPSRGAAAPITTGYRLVLPKLREAAAAGHEVEQWWTGWAISKEGYLAAFEHLSIPEPATILDVGCGDGLTTCFYARRYPSAEVVGIDRQSVTKARAHATALKVDNVRFVEGDAGEIAALIPGGVFDLIACRCTLLSHIRSRSTLPFARNLFFEVKSEAAMLLAAIAGALRPGTGRFVSTEGWDSVARLHTFLGLLASVGLYPDWEVSRPIWWGAEADRSVWSMIATRVRAGGDSTPPSIEEVTAFLVGADLEASGSLPTVYGHAARALMQHLQPRELLLGIDTRHAGLAAWRRELWGVGSLVVAYDYTEHDDAEVRLWPWSAAFSLRSALEREAQDFLANGWEVILSGSPCPVRAGGADRGIELEKTKKANGVARALDRSGRVGDAPPPLQAEPVARFSRPQGGHVIAVASEAGAAPRLSKSKVLAGQQCRRRLWLASFAPELAGAPDCTTEATFTTGTEIGRMAHALFPDGVCVETLDFADARSHTQSLMADPRVPAIFEAALELDGVRIRADVLERLDEGSWGLREVKSSSAVHDVHLDDVAVQWHVLEGTLRVSSVEVIHVDTRYVRGAGPIDPRSFFLRTDVMAEAAERMPRIPAIISELHETLARSNAPEVEPSSHCWTPYDCEFWEHCTRGKPADWIYHLPRVRTVQADAFRAAGIERITDIPADVELSAVQARIREALQTGRPYVSSDLGAALAGFGPPAYYLDFETMNPGIPLYSGTRPYERIPFQFSLHHIDGAGAILHREFLADGRSDPRRALAEALLAAATGAEPIVVYSGFEASVLSDLSGAFPDLVPQLEGVRGLLRDLLPVVRTHVYHPDFHCSFSLKSVAPALVPGFGYGDLEGISDGGAASESFHLLAAGTPEPQEEERVRRALLAYCERDTLALVKLHRVLLDHFEQEILRRQLNDRKILANRSGR